MITRMLITFVLLAPTAVAQEPSPAGDQPPVPHLYDVRHLVGPPEGTLPPPAPTAEQVAAYLQDRVLGSAGSAEAAGGSRVRVRAPGAFQKRVGAHVDRIRGGSPVTHRLVLVYGDLVGAPPASRERRTAVLERWKGLMISNTEEKLIVTNVPEEAASVVGPGPVQLFAQEGPDVEPQPFMKLKQAWFGSLGLHLLHRGELKLGRTVRFIAGYELVTGVIDHPGGVPVPDIQELLDGARVAAWVGPGDDGRLKLALSVHTGRLTRITPEETPHGPVHVPDTRQAHVEATLLLAPEQTVAVRLDETWERVLVVRISRNEGPKQDRHGGEEVR